MSDFENEWTVEAALRVLEHPTVDSKLWAEAAEWLLLHGPPKVRELLRRSAQTATSECFPELRPEGYTADGEPCYNVAEVARVLGISEEEAVEVMAAKEMKHGTRHLFDKDETNPIQ